MYCFLPYRPAVRLQLKLALSCLGLVSRSPSVLAPLPPPTGPVWAFCGPRSSTETGFD
ncbi:uncharacterized protein B0I36DRAFT_309803, partial [Microdochium trichocladiopsis]